MKLMSKHDKILKYKIPLIAIIFKDIVLNKHDAGCSCRVIRVTVDTTRQLEN